ncbi:MAG: peptidylprolyl isomerase [Bacteroidota bacterium]
MQRIIFIFLAIVSVMACNKPIADFAYSSDEDGLVAPIELKFENKSEKAESYMWDFGDGKTSTEISPKHTYTSSGNYAVQLVATKGKKSAVLEKKILVEQPLNCLVEISTDHGNISIRLSNATPQHRDNFIKLVENGYFDGTLFHRVINGFMIQGGDPNSKGAKQGQPLGMGGPGYTVPAEFVDSLIHSKGAIAAARTGGPSNPEKRSSGSQFYLVQGQVLSDQRLDALENNKGIRYSPEERKTYTTIGGTPQLDREYTVFGYVVDGLDVIDKIAKVSTDNRDRPRKDVAMKIKVIK